MLRRHKEREKQLEDALLAMKQELEAAQSGETRATSSAKQAGVKKSDALQRLKAAEVERDEAKSELAVKVAELDTVRKESHAALEQLQQASCKALQSAEQRASTHVEDLTAQMQQVEADNAELQQQLAAAQSESRAASPELDPENSALILASDAQQPPHAWRRALADLQQRNHSLQLALAQASPRKVTQQQHTAGHGSGAQQCGIACANCEEARNDVVHLTERLSTLAASNAALLREQSEHQTKAQVPLSHNRQCSVQVCKRKRGQLQVFQGCSQRCATDHSHGSMTCRVLRLVQTCARLAALTSIIMCRQQTANACRRSMHCSDVSRSAQN